MSVSRPEFTAPSFEACYRHPDRSTGIRCQRCGKPICGECMNPASVGFQCPDCIRTGRSSARQPRTAFGGALSVRDAPVTKVLIAVLLAVMVLDMISRGLLNGLLMLSNALLVLDGQFWRLVTYPFSTEGLLSTAMVALILWFAGRPLEHQLGSWRFLLLYALSGFGGATLLFVVGPLGAGGTGASAAVIGLLAANGVVKQRRGEDIRPDIGLLVILVLLNFVGGWGGLGWVAQVGGILVGALAGIALVHAPRERRSTTQIVGLVGVTAICVAAIVIKMILV